MGMKAVDHLRQRRHAVDAMSGQRVRRMAVGAQHRVTVARCGVEQTAGRVTVARQRGLVERLAEMPLVVQPQDVQPLVPYRVRGIDPARRGARGRIGA